MKYLDEYRDDKVAKKILDEICRTVTRPWVIMEVCGGQTHTIVKYGLDHLLPPEIELVHGPGCPVCVTPLDMIDRAHAIARAAGRDLLLLRRHVARAGSDGDLFQVRAARRRRADRLLAHGLPEDRARRTRKRKVVFFAIGFETTAPANAMAVVSGEDAGIRNFSLLVSHVLVPPAMTGILQSPGNRVQGFLGPGPRLRRDGLDRVRADRGALRTSDRHHRLRAAGPAGGRSDDGAAARGGAGRARKPICPRGDAARATRPRGR